MSATFGRWLYRPGQFDDWGFVRDENGPLVARALGPSCDEATEAEHRRNGTDPYEAYARLISAAPELLAACKELRDALAALMRANDTHVTSAEAAGAWVKEVLCIHGFGKRADAAIRKAEGH